MHESNEDKRVIELITLRDKVYSPEAVFYPSCGYDDSPSKVFRNVTYLDREGDVVSFHQRSKRDIIPCDISEAQLPKYDFLILRNPAIKLEIPLRHLEDGGYVLANNSHGSALWLFQHPEEFDFVAGLGDPENDSLHVVSAIRNVGDYFQRVKSLEEMRTLRPKAFEGLIGEIKTALEARNAVQSGVPDVDFMAFCSLKGYPTKMPFRRDAISYVFRKR